MQLAFLRLRKQRVTSPPLLYPEKFCAFRHCLASPVSSHRTHTFSPSPHERHHAGHGHSARRRAAPHHDNECQRLPAARSRSTSWRPPNEAGTQASDVQRNQAIGLLAYGIRCGPRSRRFLVRVLGRSYAGILQRIDGRTFDNGESSSEHPCATTPAVPLLSAPYHGRASHRDYSKAD